MLGATEADRQFRRVALVGERVTAVVRDHVDSRTYLCGSIVSYPYIMSCIPSSQRSIPPIDLTVRYLHDDGNLL